MRSNQSPGFKATPSRVLLPRERDQREDQGLHTYLWVSGQTEVRQAEQRLREVTGWQSSTDLR